MILNLIVEIKDDGDI